jgi:hypothetical protein
MSVNDQMKKIAAQVGMTPCRNVNNNDCLKCRCTCNATRFFRLYQNYRDPLMACCENYAIFHVDRSIYREISFEDMVLFEVHEP